MHNLEQKMIEFGAIDTSIESIHIDEWFENVKIIFVGKNDMGNVVCSFKNCFEVSLNHDRTYSKGMGENGTLDYKYFIQDVEISEDEDFYIFKISAWPLDGEIICKEINIELENLICLR